MSNLAKFKVRFVPISDERLNALIKAYDRIRERKTKNVWPENKEDWMRHFDANALSHFWWPTKTELEAWKEKYFATPWEKRIADPSLQHPWDFMSLFEAFKNGDYALLSIVRLTETEAALPFEPSAHPYGGTGCMRALIEAFDHRVITEPDET
jgi:hypothetical protein